MKPWHGIVVFAAILVIVALVFMAAGTRIFSVNDAEKVKRELAGSSMTTSEKVGSMANQAKNSVQADTDKAKREVRNNT